MIAIVVYFIATIYIAVVVNPVFLLLFALIGKLISEL